MALALETMRSRLHAEECGRQAFLATASHELRTPLASLRGTVELLEEELARGAPDLGGFAGAPPQLVGRPIGDKLAEDLLDLGRLDGNAVLAREPVELRELAGTLAAELAGAAHAAGVGLEVDAPATVWAEGDPRATTPCCVPCSRTPWPRRAAGQRRDDRGGHDGRPAHVRVSDAGPGVPEAERERIFGRFERGEGAGAGFGLGLAIARGLARQMGGDVSARAAKHGACFEVTLPVCAIRPAPRRRPRMR